MDYLADDILSRFGRFPRPRPLERPLGAIRRSFIAEESRSSTTGRDIESFRLGWVTRGTELTRDKNSALNRSPIENSASKALVLGETLTRGITFSVVLRTEILPGKIVSVEEEPPTFETADARETEVESSRGTLYPKRGARGAKGSQSRVIYLELDDSRINIVSASGIRRPFFFAGLINELPRSVLVRWNRIRENGRLTLITTC